MKATSVTLTPKQVRAVVFKLRGLPTEWPGINHEMYLDRALKKLFKAAGENYPEPQCDECGHELRHHYEANQGPKCTGFSGDQFICKCKGFVAKKAEP